MQAGSARHTGGSDGVALTYAGFCLCSRRGEIIAPLAITCYPPKSLWKINLARNNKIMVLGSCCRLVPAGRVALCCSVQGESKPGNEPRSV